MAILKSSIKLKNFSIKFTIYGSEPHVIATLIDGKGGSQLIKLDSTEAVHLARILLSFAITAGLPGDTKKNEDES